MKLRLPKALMSAMAAAVAAAAPIATTVATGTLLAAGAAPAYADGEAPEGEQEVSPVVITSDTPWAYDEAVDSRAAVSITGGTLTIGDGQQHGFGGQTFQYGKSITIDSGATLNLQVWNGQDKSVPSETKAQIGSRIILNGGTLKTKGANYFVKGIAVEDSSTILQNYAGATVYGAITNGAGGAVNENTVLTFNRVEGNNAVDNLQIFAGEGDFGGIVAMHTNEKGTVYIINNALALQNANVQLVRDATATSNATLRINTATATFAALSGAGDIVLNGNSWGATGAASTLITLTGHATGTAAAPSTFSGTIGSGVSITVANTAFQTFNNITLGSGSTLDLGDNSVLSGTLALTVTGANATTPVITTRGDVSGVSTVTVEGTEAGTAYALIQTDSAQKASAFVGGNHGGVNATSFDNLFSMYAVDNTVMGKLGNTVTAGSTITLDGGAIKLASNTAAYDGAYTSEGSTRTATATFSGDTTLDLTFGAGDTKSKVFNAARPAGSTDNITVTLNTLTISGNTNTAANGSATINGANGVNVVYTKSGDLGLYAQNLTLGNNVSLTVTGITDIGGATKLTLNEGSSFTTRDLRLTGGSGNYTGAVTINGGTLTVTGNRNTRTDTYSALMISHWRANGNLTLEKGQLIANDAIMYLSWDISGNNIASSVGGSYIQKKGEAWLKGISAQRRNDDAPSQSTHSVATLSGGTLHLGSGGLQYIFSDSNGTRFTFGDVTIIAEDDWKTYKGSGSIGLAATAAGEKTTIDANGHTVTFNHALTGGGNLITKGNADGEGTITFNKNVTGNLEVQSGDTVINADVTNLKATGGTAWIKYNVSANVQLNGGTVDAGKGVTLANVTALGSASGDPISSKLETHAANITNLTVQSGAAVEQHGAITVNAVNNSGSLTLNGPVILGGNTASGKTELVTTSDLYIRRVLDAAEGRDARTAVKTGAGNLELGDGIGDGNILEVNGGTLSGSFDNGTLKVGVSGLTATGKTLTVDGGRIDFASRMTDGALTAIAVGDGSLVLQSGNLVFGSAMSTLMTAATTAGEGWTTDLFTYTDATHITSNWKTSDMMVDGSSVDSKGHFYIYDASGNITRQGILTVGDTALTLSFSGALGLDRLTWTGATDNVWDSSTANWTGDSTVFSDEAMVVFGASRENVTVTLSGELAPADITVLGNYTFTGSGSIKDIPRLNVGDNSHWVTLVIGTDNHEWAGEVYVKDGSALELAHKYALGTSAVYLEGESDLRILASGTYANHIVGAGQLTVNNGADVVLTNSSNSYSGGTFITNGTLTVTNGGALGNGSTLTIDGAGTFAIRGASPEDELVKLTFARAITGAGNITASYTGEKDNFYSYEFTRSITGNGDDIAAWTGTYRHDDGGTYAAKTGIVEFNGASDGRAIKASFLSTASEGAPADIQNDLTVRFTATETARTFDGSFDKTGRNKLNIEISGAASNTFNGVVNATSLTILGSATTFNKNVTVDDLTLTGGSLTRGANNNLTVNGRFDTDLNLEFTDKFTGGAGFTKAGIGTLVLKACNNNGETTLAGAGLVINSFGVEGGVLMLQGKLNQSYDKVTLGGGQLILHNTVTNFGGNASTSTKTAIGRLDVTADSTLKMRWYQSFVELGGISLNDNTLTIDEGHCSDNLSVISLTGASAGSGAIVVLQNDSDTDSKSNRHVHVSIDGANTLDEALLTFASKNSSNAKVSIGISTNASIGGLGEGLADVKLMSLGKTSVASGQGSSAYNAASDARRTLTITGTNLVAGETDANTFNGVVGNNIDLVMNAQEGGTQIFNGDLSAFDGSVSVVNGKLVFAGDTSPAISSLTVGTADTAETVGATFDLQVAPAAAISQLQGAANGVLTNSGDTWQTLTVGRTGTSNNSNFAGAITGNLNVEVAANTLTLTGANTSIGNLTVTNGKALLSDNGVWAGNIYASGSSSVFAIDRTDVDNDSKVVDMGGSINISDGATFELQLWKSGPSNGQTILTTDKSTVTADIYLNSGNIKITEGANRFSSITTNGTSKIESVYSKGQYIDHLSGDGTLTLQQNNHIWGGNSVISIDGADDFNGTISMVNNATIELHLVSINGTSLSNAIINTGTSANNKLVLNTAETTIAGLSGAGGVIFATQGEIGTATPLTAGTLKIAAAAGADNVFSGSIADGINLELVSGAQTVSGLAMAGGLTIDNTATLTLNGDAISVGGYTNSGKVVFGNTGADVTIGGTYTNGAQINLGNLVVGGTNVHLTGLASGQRGRVLQAGSDTTDTIVVIGAGGDMIWNGDEDTHVWNATATDWTLGGDENSFFCGDDVVFENNSAHKIVTVADNVLAGSMVVNGAYTFDIAADKTVGTGSLGFGTDGGIKVKDGGTLQVTGTNGKETMLAYFAHATAEEGYTGTIAVKGGFEIGEYGKPATINVNANFEVDGDLAFNGIYSTSTINVNENASLTVNGNLSISTKETLVVKGGDVKAGAIYIGHVQGDFAGMVKLESGTLTVDKLAFYRAATQTVDFTMTGGTLHFTGTGNAIEASTTGNFTVNLLGGKIVMDALQTSVNAQIGMTVGGVGIEAANSGAGFTFASALTQKGTVTLTGTGGVLNFNGNITLDSSSGWMSDSSRGVHDDTEGAIEGNGFLNDLVLVDNRSTSGGTVTYGSGVTVSYNGASLGNASAVITNNNGTCTIAASLIDGEGNKQYYINSGTVIYGGVDNASASATGITVQGTGELTLARTMTARDGVTLKKDATITLTQTGDTAVVLNASQVTLNGHSMTLAGNGTYGIATANSLGSGVSLASGWTGTVSTSTTGDLDTTNLMHEGSSILLGAGSMGTINATSGTLKSNANISIGTLNAKSGTTILDGQGVAREFKVTGTYDMRGRDGDPYTGTVRLVNGANLSAKNGDIWLSQRNTHTSVIEIDDESSFTSNDGSWHAQYVISGRLDDTYATVSRVAKSGEANPGKVTDMGADYMRYNHAVVDYQGTGSAVLAAGLEDSDVVVSGGGTLSIGEKTIHELSATNGTAQATGVVTMNSAKVSADGVLKASGEGVLKLSGKDASIDVKDSYSLSGADGTMKNVVLTASGVDKATSDDGVNNIKTLGEMNSLKLEAAASMSVENVVMQDVAIGIKTGFEDRDITVTYANATAVGSSASVSAPGSGAVQARDGEGLSGNQNRTLTTIDTTVQTGGKATGTLTVDIANSLIIDSRGSDLTWTILSGVDLTDFKLAFDGELLKMIEHGIPEVKLTATNAAGATQEWVVDSTNYRKFTTDANFGNFGSGVTLVLDITNVPEPATGVLSVLALAGLAARRRRKA